MEIKNNILKEKLKNCYFIVGTAYAGKSTMCKKLAETYNMHHCKENFHFDYVEGVINPEDQPNMSYFDTMSGWEEFLNRSPETYKAWIDNTSEEVAAFEVVILMELSKNQKVIVDSNIPIKYLKEIANPNQVAVMVADPRLSVENFFDREDPDKKFLLDQIDKCKDPIKTRENFRQCLMALNNPSEIELFKESGFFYLYRDYESSRSLEETFDLLSKHFQLNKEEKGSRDND